MIIQFYNNIKNICSDCKGAGIDDVIAKICANVWKEMYLPIEGISLPHPRNSKFSVIGPICPSVDERVNSNNLVK